MTARLAIAAVTAWTIGFLAVLPADAEPRKEYMASELVQCTRSVRCPIFRQRAVNHARTFCQAEGGVKVGDRPNDYHCEQRGMNCVISGTIECKGRVDPRKAPGEVQGTPLPELPGASRPSSCLDSDCDMYVDYAPGHREQGLHACRAGYAMVGLGGATNDILCRRISAAFVESMIDLDTQRRGLRACPSGQIMIGIADDRSRLLCGRFRATFGADWRQPEDLDHGLQVCDEREGRPHYLTGIDGAREGLLCAALQ